MVGFKLAKKQPPLIKFYVNEGETMSLIYIRQATKNDLEQIMPIIDEAKKFLKEEGTRNGKVVIPMLKQLLQILMTV